MGGRGAFSMGGFGSQEIADWLGVDKATAEAYMREWGKNGITPPEGVQAEHAQAAGSSQMAGDLGTSQEAAKDYIDSLSHWTGISSYDVREYQQTGGGPDDIKQMSRNLEDYIQASPKWYGGDTFRGINGISDKTLADLTTVGAKVDMRGTSSWSTDESVAHSFAKGMSAKSNNVIFVAKSQPKGTSIRGYSGHPTEQEVIVSKSAEYTVRQAAFDKGKNAWYVYLDNA